MRSEYIQRPLPRSCRRSHRSRSHTFFCVAVCCSVLQCVVMEYLNTYTDPSEIVQTRPQIQITLQHTHAARHSHCNTHTQIHITLQHTHAATQLHYNTLTQTHSETVLTRPRIQITLRLLCCSALQRVAACCDSASQYTHRPLTRSCRRGSRSRSHDTYTISSVLQFVAVCCSVLRLSVSILSQTTFENV